MYHTSVGLKLEYNKTLFLFGFTVAHGLSFILSEKFLSFLDRNFENRNFQFNSNAWVKIVTLRQ